MQENESIQDRPRRKRRSQEQIAQLVGEFKSSGLTQRQFSESQGIVLSELQRSLKIMRRAREPELMAVQIEAAECSDVGLELMVGAGYRIKIGAGFSATALRRLLEGWPIAKGMLGFGSATRVYVAIGATDMRKGFEGLFGIVRDRLMIDPLSGHVFVLIVHLLFLPSVRTFRTPYHNHSPEVWAIADGFARFPTRSRITPTNSATLVSGSSIIVSSRTVSPAYPKSFGRRATVHADLCEASHSHKNVITPPMPILVAECFFLQEIRRLRGS